MIQKTHPLSKLRRCELLNISRSSIYYQPKSVSDIDQTLMMLIDETHTAKSFLGSRRIVDSLAEDHNQVVNRKRVSRLMKVMGDTGYLPQTKDHAEQSAA
jgi:putative transposase